MIQSSMWVFNMNDCKMGIRTLSCLIIFIMCFLQTPVVSLAAIREMDYAFDDKLSDSEVFDKYAEAYGWEQEKFLKKEWNYTDYNGITNSISRSTGHQKEFLADNTTTTRQYLGLLSLGGAASYMQSVPVEGDEIVLPGEDLGTQYTYERWMRDDWSRSSNQYALIQKYGYSFDSDGLGIIDHRYVVACTTLYGTVGQKIDVYLSSGEILHCIIGDAKNTSDQGCNQYGHNNGKNIIEFMVQWSGASHPNAGTNSFHPEWKGLHTVKVVVGPNVLYS